MHPQTDLAIRVIDVTLCNGEMDFLSASMETVRLSTIQSTPLPSIFCFDLSWEEFELRVPKRYTGESAASRGSSIVGGLGEGKVNFLMSKQPRTLNMDVQVDGVSTRWSQWILPGQNPQYKIFFYLNQMMMMMMMMACVCMCVCV